MMEVAPILAFSREYNWFFFAMFFPFKFLSLALVVLMQYTPN